MYKGKNHQSGSPSSRISTDVNVLAYIISAFSPFFFLHSPYVENIRESVLKSPKPLTKSERSFASCSDVGTTFLSPKMAAGGSVLWGSQSHQIATPADALDLSGKDSRGMGTLPGLPATRLPRKEEGYALFLPELEVGPKANSSREDTQICHPLYRACLAPFLTEVSPS